MVDILNIEEKVTNNLEFGFYSILEYFPDYRDKDTSGNVEIKEILYNYNIDIVEFVKGFYIELYQELAENKFNFYSFNDLFLISLNYNNIIDYLKVFLFLYYKERNDKEIEYRDEMALLTILSIIILKNHKNISLTNK